MGKFIYLKDTFNPLSTQGEGEKYINVEHIIHISNWPKSTSKRISTLKTRIKMLDGEILDVREPMNKIIELIKASDTLN
jgi:hypothetical protein